MREYGCSRVGTTLAHRIVGPVRDGFTHGHVAFPPRHDSLIHPGNMLTIWIIHRDAHHRAALARIAGAGDNAVLAGPLDRMLESATRPSVVVLGLGDDFEHELEFVHRFRSRLAGCPWVVLPPKADIPEARRLFDTLPARFLAYPPSPNELRRALRDALRRRTGDRLSVRQERDALRDRFSRWFGDVELPELMRALDPRMMSVPVLIRGEAGTGRGILARYVHTFGGGPDEAFVHVCCRGIQHAEELLGQIESGAEKRDERALTIWLEDVDLLPFAVQRRLQDWIEYGPPDGRPAVASIRWIVGASDEAELDTEPGLESRLAEALAGITLRIRALRDRPEAIDAFVSETSRAWADQRSERVRQWSPDARLLLRAYPWPGNLHELEATVVRTLSFTGADPILPVHLRFPGDSGWLDRYTDSDRATESTEPSISADEGDLPEATPLADDELEVVIGTLEDEAPESDFPARESGSAPAAYEMAVAAMENVLAPRPEPASAAAVGRSPESAQSDLRQMVRALVHDVRNPLVSIRTFSELLPEHYDDDEFRTHFSDLVSQDVVRIDDALKRLQAMLDVSTMKSESVDIAALLEQLLDEHRSEIQARRLLVLKELDHSVPHAIGDPELLRDAFSALIKRALGSVSDRGDVYIASRHHAGGGHAGGGQTGTGTGKPTLRVLIRHGTEAGANQAAGATAHLDVVMAQSIVQSLGGTFTQDRTDAHECVVVIDLPAPD